MPEDMPVGVVGAGPSGIAAAAALRGAGYRVEVLERHSAVGGIWDIANPGTPMYETAHYISSRTVSGFPGFPMPADYPDYPRHDRILSYIRSYADYTGVTPLVRTGHEVVKGELRANGRWHVSVRTAAGEAERRYRALVLATGHQWEPRMPSWPGTFDGELMHAKEYTGPGQLRGKRVLVIGGGNSGVDIVSDAARDARSATISLRRGYWFIPKHMFGKPVDVIAESGPRLPKRLEQLVFQALLRTVVGDLRRFGLPRPDHRVLDSHPIVNSTLLQLLAHGDVTVAPDVRAFAGDRVEFTDGRCLPFDTVIAATGYRVSFPFLDPALFRWHGERPDLWLNVVHPGLSGLFVIGMLEANAAAAPLLAGQAALAAAVLRAQDRQDPRLDSLVRERPPLSGGLRYVGSARHALAVDAGVYRRHLGRAVRTLGGDGAG
ncbi:NAD(P)/FAD-dependent oxidoreductase [Amycolatopsis sp. MtRt-6]|uniref:flavin-containing monooxygenase n=1 Tax=Amycolatopsis sp. MtRt-6 TaxID=2792782 RepID=UPI001A8CF561|nr:NAD(P)/FAD-dependent oxidoreductase [Amycolatopsis sp. MtRt-6]